MNLKKILIVYKKSAFETYLKSASIMDAGLKRIRSAHFEHYKTLEFVKKTLSNYGIAFNLINRGKPFQESQYDLIFSVGGDGTFLDAAKYVKDKMILGVNSDTSHSVGSFCVAQRKNFDSILQKVLAGNFKTKKLNRLQIKVNQKVWPHPILNDILVAHSCPAAMSHYILKVDDKIERQRSSGLWVSTAAGSSGAMKSARGKVLEIESKVLQYLPRELFWGHGAKYQLRGGAITQNLSVDSQMQEGVIYVDGPHTKISFKYATKLAISNSKTSLKTICF